MSTVLTVFGCYLALWLVINAANLVLSGPDQPRSKDEALSRAISTFVLCLIGGAVTSYFMMT